MIKFTKPANLNGAELLNELKAAGVTINDYPTLDGNNELWLPIAAKDEEKAQTVVGAHNGSTAQKEPTIDEKLASVGLSIDSLKAALGI
jgi:hypothetical protein